MWYWQTLVCARKESPEKKPLVPSVVLLRYVPNPIEILNIYTMLRPNNNHPKCRHNVVFLWSLFRGIYFWYMKWSNMIIPRCPEYTYLTLYISCLIVCFIQTPYFESKMIIFNILSAVFGAWGFEQAALWQNGGLVVPRCCALRDGLWTSKSFIGTVCLWLLSHYIYQSVFLCVPLLRLISQLLCGSFFDEIRWKCWKLGQNDCLKNL